MRSKKLLRQIKKTFQAEDFEISLNKAICILKNGNQIDNPSAFYDNLEAFSEFLDAIDNSYTQSETMLDLANRSLDVSTRELFQTNEKFRLLNQSISAMVNSLDEGFLVIDRKGLCGEVVSSAAIRFLDRNPKNENLAEILNIKPAEKETFLEWLNMLFNEIIPFDDLIELAPKYLNLDDSTKKIEIKLKPIRSTENNKIRSIVLILTDISEKIAAEQKLDEQKIYTEMVIKYLNSKPNFLRVIRLTMETATTMQSWTTDATLWNESFKILTRELHTLKGGLNTLSIYALGHKIHQIEDDLLTFCSTNFDLQKKINLIKKLGTELSIFLNNFLEENKHVFTFNKNNVQSIKEIPTNSIYKFYEELLKIDQPNLLKSYLDEFVTIPFIHMFAPIESNIYSLAISLGKEVSIIYHDPKFIKVIPEFYNPLFEQLVHIFNNIVDHGIESREERSLIGKLQTGTIEIKVGITESIRDKTKKLLELVISDDGKGINPKIIRAKLDEAGISHNEESDTQVIYHIFDQGFSTSAETTLTSGRGVGMTSVFKMVRQMGGQLEVNSNLNEGTSFKITIPFINELDSSSSQRMSYNGENKCLAG
jgi:two-component system chemotaxis sensor kinase CheA